MTPVSAWEDVGVAGDDHVRRCRVPGGWLYQVRHSAFVDPVESRPGYWVHGWHAPVFVSEATS